MRLTKLVLLGALLACASLGSATAQTSTWTTTQEVAACATDADQPVCFLRVLSHFPTHSPYAADWRLVGARDVLRALGETGAAERADNYNNIPYATTRMIYGYLDQTDGAVANAILVDRRGGTTEQALRHVVGEIGLEQGMPDGNAGAVCLRLSKIWRAYGTERDRANRPNLPRPSERLARASVETCDRANAPVDSVSPYELAEQYVRFGNVEAARRVMTRDTRPAALVEVETAVLINDLDAAARLVAQPARNFDERTRPRFERLRGDALKEAQDAGRTDLVVAIARATIDDFFSEESARSSPNLETALEAWGAVGDRAEVTRYTERLDAAGRDIMQQRSFSAAIAAQRSWIALGDTTRARALADHWAPRVQWQYESNAGGCGGERPFCASYGVMEMYLRLGDPEEGWRIAHRDLASMTIGTDFSAGRGLQHLDAHLAHARDERGRNRLLSSCVQYANRTREQIAWARECATRVVARIPDIDPADRDALVQRYSAASAALRVADLASRVGDEALMREMLQLALSSYAAMPVAPLQPSERAELLEIAIYQLELANRL